MVELEPEPEQQATLQHTAGHGGITDRAEQDRVLGADLGQYGIGQRLPGAVPALRAKVVRGGVDGDVRRLEDLDRFGDDFRADAVAADHGELDR